MAKRLIAILVVVCFLTSCRWIANHPKTVIITPAVAGGVVMAANADGMDLGVAPAFGLGALAGAFYGTIVWFLPWLLLKHPPSSGDGEGWGERWEEPLESDRPDPLLTNGFTGGCHASGNWLTSPMAQESDLVAAEGQTVMSTTGNGYGFDELEACMSAKANGWDTLKVDLCQGGGHISGYTIYKPDCTCTVCSNTDENGYEYEDYTCSVPTSALCSNDLASRARVGYGWGGALSQDEAGRLAIANAEYQSSCSIYGGTLTDSHLLGCQHHVINQGEDGNGQPLRPTEYLCAASARCDY